MKIHQTIGIVAGVHALAFLLIFAIPGCSSTTKSTAAAAAPDPVAAAPAPAPVSAAPADTSAAVPLVPAAGEGGGTVFYPPTRPNTPAAEALAPAPVAADVTPAETYTVRAGDSLWLVAHKHHLKVSELAAANNLRSTSSLHAGQKLLIPAPKGAAAATKPGASGSGAVARAPEAEPAGGAAAGEGAGKAGAQKYTVKNGDKLSTIARHFGLTTGALAAENNISDPRKIRPGQVLTIPAGGAARKGGTRHGRAAGGHAAAAEPAAAPSAAPAAEPAPAPATLEPVPSASTPAAPAGGANVPIIRIDGAGTSGAPSSAPGR